MEEIFLSSTESLQIGLCLGEFLQRSKADCSVRFLDVLESRLGPFVPQFAATELTEIPQEEIPCDCGVIIGQGTPQVARSETHPDALFIIMPPKSIRFIIHHRRKSLLDHLVSILRDHVALSVKDWLVYFTAEGIDLQRWGEPLLACAPLSLYKLERRNGNEDHDAITRCLTKLVAFNEGNELFNIGRNFGRAVAICEGFSERLARVTVDEVEQAAVETKFPRFGDEDFDPDVDEVPDIDALDESDLQAALDGVLDAGELDDYPSALHDLTASRRINRLPRVNDFRCSIDEAVFFVKGIRALLDLSERIRDAK